jgi:GT2 family glycosyltransferase
MNDRVYVVVVTHNSAALLPELASSLRIALGPVGPHTVVVVDNASTDGTADLVPELLPDAHLLSHANCGYAAGINAALRAVPTSAPVLVLNPDVRLRPDCVEHLLSALAVEGVGIAVPRLVDGDGKLLLSLRRDPSLLRMLGETLLGTRRAGRLAALGETVTDPAAYAHARSVDWATGAVMLIAPGCRVAVGEWDESFFLYSEETEFAGRARAAGWSVRFVPEAVAVHIGGEALTSPRLLGLMLANKVRLFRRRHRRLPSTVFAVTVFAHALSRALVGSAAHRGALASFVRPRRVIPRAAAAAPADGWVCFSAQDWWYHNRAHSDVQLMRNLARERPVLFVNSIGMRMPLPGRSTHPWRRGARKVRSTLRYLRRPVPELPQFHVMTPLVLPAYGSRRGRAFNAALVRLQVAGVARRIGLRNPDVVVTIPTALPVAERLSHHRIVFNRSDNHSAFPEVNGAVIRGLEEQLLTRADHVVYVSHELMERDAPLSGQRAVFLDHGIDLDRFTVGERPLPDDLVAIARPRIGFFGGFDDYIIDFDLLEKVAVEVAEAQLVLIGDATCSMASLTRHPNVHWLGVRAYADIPAYGAGFDVALMPWLDNDWIRYANPIKLKEYLALGLPVVSTDFPEVHHYGHVVDVAADADDFVRLVRERLAHPGDADSRRAAVAGDSWRRRASTLTALVAAG